MLIKCYTVPEYISDKNAYIISGHNDFFKLYIGSMLFTTKEGRKSADGQLEVITMAAIDGIQGINDNGVKSPFSASNFEDLSRGTKVILNTLYLLREKERGKKSSYVIDARGIGWNAKRILFHMLSRFDDRVDEFKVIIGLEPWKQFDLSNKSELTLGEIGKLNILMDEYLAIDSIEKIHEYLINQKLNLAPLEKYQDKQMMIISTRSILANEKGNSSGIDKLPFPHLEVKLGKVDISLDFKCRLTLLFGDSGVGKSLLANLVTNLRAESDDSGLFNTEVFNYKRPVTLEALERIHNRVDSMPNTLVIIDDQDSLITEEIGEWIHNTSAQVVLALRDYSQIYYGPENVAVMSRDAHYISLNYPLIGVVNSMPVEERSVKLNNRPMWSLSKGMDLAEFKQTIAESNISANNISNTFKSSGGIIVSSDSTKRTTDAWDEDMDIFPK